MSKPFIFVSCGQHSESEKSLGRSIVKMVKTTAGMDAFFAEEVQDLNGLDSNILGALHDCAALITVMHPRGNIVRPDNSTHTRASVWIEQEICHWDLHSARGKEGAAGDCVHPCVCWP